VQVTRTHTVPSASRDGDPEKQLITEEVPFDLHSRADLRKVIASLKESKGRDNAFVVFLSAEDPSDKPFDLSMLFQQAPGLAVYIFHLPTDDKCGVFEGGDGAAGNLLIALCDMKVDPVEVIVEDILIKGCTVVVAGLPGQNKSLFCMELAAAVINKRKVSDHFEVHASYPFIWACRDMDPSLQMMWGAQFGLADEKMRGMFKVIDPGCDVLWAIDSPAFTCLVRDHILILDTMWDFANIEKSSESGEWVAFFQKLHRLMTHFGCIAVILLVHPTKAGAEASATSLSAWLKDSITFAGKADLAFAFSARPGTSQTLVERIKHRGFKEKNFSFTITTHSEEGENYIDTGRFPVYEKPGEAGSKADYAPKRGAKGDPERDKYIKWLMTQERVVEGVALKAERLNQHFKTKHPIATVKTWLRRGREDRREQKELMAETIRDMASDNPVSTQRVLDEIQPGRVLNQLERDEIADEGGE
jgi:hypothetical protein